MVFEEEKKMDAADLAKLAAMAPKETTSPVSSAPAQQLPSKSVSPTTKLPRLGQRTGIVLRTLLLDLPLLIVLLTAVAASWCHYVGYEYLVPQYYDMLMSPERQNKEMTYYVRACTKEDMSALSGEQLFLAANATVEDAYQHQLKHGFTIFRSVLTPDTAENLRDYVNERNYKLTEQEVIYVIENDNRYSFGLGTDEPVVAKAMKELTTHKLLRASVEKILGPDPALIEMTAITASYGAVHQWWHDDVIPQGSPIRHARAFGPSYSLFIQVSFCCWQRKSSLMSNACHAS